MITKYAILSAQFALFVALLPFYSAVYLEVFNRVQNLAYPGTFWTMVRTGIDHWKYLEFGRPFEALFSISASVTTVFAISILVWWSL